ncbi:hypothetical protein [Lignipirellula cremea]|uniref:hypothetical protein n=1 Tax=Lignipirellula cremea TaxID=2528010 RepID=UPI0011A6C3E9|nr:hypothetical protein [Lignipirellula cremea]
MLQSVNIFRERKTGNFVLNPNGTFRGYGAYVALFPYREVNDPSPERVGLLVVDMLEHSGPTGYRISQIQEYDDANLDDETRYVREKYFSSRKQDSTSALAKKFAHGKVEYRAGQKSWLIRSLKYSSELRSLEPFSERRVKHSTGVEQLGEAVTKMLEEV